MNWVWGLSTCAGATLLGTLLGAACAPEPRTRLTIADAEYLVDPGNRPGLVEVIRLRARRYAAREVSIRAEGEILQVPGDELGFEVDLEAAVNLAEEKILGARGAADSTFSGFLYRRLVREPLTVHLELPVQFEEDVARLKLVQLQDLVDRDAVDAELLIDEHRIVASEWGAKLSVDATLVRLHALDPSEELVVDAVVDELRPAVTEEDLTPVDISRVLATFETSFAGKAGSRAVNIRRAAKYLDGAVILPGEVFSFNSRVGRRVHGRGFVDAPVIINDELEDDVGGGVCQVATTLHGAAVYGNLAVVQRRSHSRPSGYAPLGLDATVIDGAVDLRIRNPFDEAILVHATFPTRYKIRVELLGRDPTAKVEHAYAVTHREPFARRVWYKQEIAKKAFEKKQKGSQGMDVTSVLRITHEDGRTERRSYHSKYYPVPEVFYAGEGATVETLPPMPEEAVGLVINGEEGPVEAAPPAPTDVPTIDEADGLGRQTEG